MKIGYITTLVCLQCFEERTKLPPTTTDFNITTDINLELLNQILGRKQDKAPSSRPYFIYLKEESNTKMTESKFLIEKLIGVKKSVLNIQNFLGYTEILLLEHNAQILVRKLSPL
ncbi:hypothetical protein M153_1920009572 [Pseudoloma neurophilia]|uniref:Uncharacterized protein n=1 Tax=Pseudoloma neurophilia TaxID=146866 RepID=A0A0R0M526_9MICR|nr:hypothetical protein M153_1920009572 [Pseudoloma neurophilia]